VGDDRLGVAADSRVQHLLVVRIVELGTDLKINDRLFDEAGEEQEEAVDLGISIAMDFGMDRTLEHGLVLEVETGGGNHLKAALKCEVEKTATGPCGAAEGGDENRGVEDEAHGEKGIAVRSISTPLLCNRDA